eukprot:785069-Rhodomonas_salina.1
MPSTDRRMVLPDQGLLRAPAPPTLLLRSRSPCTTCGVAYGIAYVIAYGISYAVHPIALRPAYYRLSLGSCLPLVLAPTALRAPYGFSGTDL